MTTVMIAESIPVFNRGEEAIMRGMIESFKKLEEVSIVYETEFANEDSVAYASSVTIIGVPFSGSGLGKFIRHLQRGINLISTAIIHLLLPKGIAWKITPRRFRPYLESDLILIGHDNLYINDIRILADTGIIFFTRLMKKKLVSYGSTIGPFKKGALSTAACRLLLDKFDLITLREAESQRYLKKIGVNRPRIEVTADLAFLMKPESSPKVESFLQATITERGGDLKKRNNLLVGVSISKILTRYALMDKPNIINRESAFIEVLVEALNRLLDRADLQIIFVNHVFGAFAGHVHDDRILHQSIIRRLTCTEKVVSTDDHFSSPELKAIIGSLDLLIASRTHTMIAAVSQYVPVVPLTHRHHFKTLGIIGEMVGLEDSMVHLEEISADSLVSVVDKTLNAREEIRQGLKDKIPSVVKRSQRNGQLIKELINPNCNR